MLKTQKRVKGGVIVTVILSLLMVSFTFAPSVNAAHNMFGYLFNPGEDLQGGPADDAQATMYLTTASGYALPARSDFILVSDMVDANGIDTPASFVYDLDNDWTTSYIGEDMLVVFEVYTGLNSYVGVTNYTAVANFTLSSVQPEYLPVPWIIPVPTITEDSNDGSTLQLSWPHERNYYDETFDLVSDGEFDEIVEWRVYSDTSGSWGVDSTATANYGGTVTWTDDISALAPGDYHYQIVPLYKGLDYENTGTTFEPTARSPVITVNKAGGGVLSQTYSMQPGYNLISFNGTLDGTNDMASELMDAVNVGIADAALAGECDQVSRWVAGTYENNVWLPTSPGPDDYLLEQGDGVWVHVTTPSGFDFTLNVTDWPTPGAQADGVEINWNMIGPIVNAPVTPAQMSDDAAPRNAKFIVGWDAVAQEYTAPFIKDFDEVPGWDVEPGVGYWVWYAEAGTQNYVA